MQKKIKILLVEDEKVVAALIIQYMEKQGHRVVHCNDGVVVLDEFVKENFDICLLDVVLPYKDGYTIAKEIRKVNHDIPILFISSNSLPKDKITGFRVGGDDYVIKPFNIEELHLRMEAILRRSLKQPLKNGFTEEQARIIKVRGFTLTVDKRELVGPDGEAVNMPVKEVEVLKCLYMNLNETVPRVQILQNVWGEDGFYASRKLDVYVSRLRKYFEEDPAIDIVGVYGVGFKLQVRED